MGQRCLSNIVWKYGRYYESTPYQGGSSTQQRCMGNQATFYKYK